MLKIGAMLFAVVVALGAWYIVASAVAVVHGLFAL